MNASQERFGEVIYEAAMRAPAGAALSSLNIARKHFVEWLDREEVTHNGD